MSNPQNEESYIDDKINTPVAVNFSPDYLEAFNSMTSQLNEIQALTTPVLQNFIEITNGIYKTMNSPEMLNLFESIGRTAIQLSLSIQPAMEAISRSLSSVNFESLTVDEAVSVRDASVDIAEYLSEEYLDEDFGSESTRAPQLETRSIIDYITTILLILDLLIKFGMLPAVPQNEANKLMQEQTAQIMLLRESNENKIATDEILIDKLDTLIDLFIIAENN